MDIFHQAQTIPIRQIQILARLLHIQGVSVRKESLISQVSWLSSGVNNSPLHQNCFLFLQLICAESLERKPEVMVENRSILKKGDPIAVKLIILDRHALQCVREC